MAVGTMMEDLSRSWGWIVLRGVAAVAFGILALLQPGITLAALVLVWGVYALVDGTLALMAGFRIKPAGKPMWPLIVMGLIGIAAGLITLFRPGITEIALLATIAAWAILVGFLQIFAAIALRKMIRNEWWMALSGLLAVAFGVLMLLRPQAGALAVVLIIAWYAMVFGIAVIMLGFRIKNLTARVARVA